MTRSPAKTSVDYIGDMGGYRKRDPWLKTEHQFSTIKRDKISEDWGVVELADGRSHDLQVSVMERAKMAVIRKGTFCAEVGENVQENYLYWKINLG